MADKILEITTPGVMLTALEDEFDRVVDFQIGADDHLTRPFSMRELLARLKAILSKERLMHQEATATETPMNLISHNLLLKYNAL